MARYLAAFNTGIDLQVLVSQVASPDVKGWLQSTILGKDVPSAEAYRKSMEIDRPALQAAYRAVFSRDRLDVLIFPTTVRPAGLSSETDKIKHNGKLVSTFLTYARNTSPASLAGIPGLSIPIGLTSARLPVGIELDAPALNDRRLLSIGLAVERVAGKLPAPDRIKTP